MSSLYELTGERLALQRKLEELDLDEQTIIDTLEGDSLSIQDKIESYCYVIRNMEALPNAMKDEIKRLQERSKVYEKRVEHIKNWLFINMQACGITKIESNAFTVAIQNNPPSVIIDDETLIPPDYFIQPDAPPPALSKTLIKQAIDAGQEVTGAHIEVKQRLVIK